MITGEKNRAQNCLAISNLKLDDIFSDVFGKSARSITEQILRHPVGKFDVTPFVDSRCKTPIEGIQAAVDGAISKKQAVKLRQCLDRINELNRHISEVEQEILQERTFSSFLIRCCVYIQFFSHRKMALSLCSNLFSICYLFVSNFLHPSKHIVKSSSCFRLVSSADRDNIPIFQNKFASFIALYML